MIALDNPPKTKKLSQKLHAELSESDDDGKSSDEDFLESDAKEETTTKTIKGTKSKKVHSQEGSKSNEFNESNENKNEVGGNSGWADVMQKILQTKKPKRKKTIVLSKAKKLCDLKKKKDEEDVPFEIEKVKEEIKTEEGEEEEEEEETKDDIKKPIVELKERRKEKSLGIRVKPSLENRERERTLQKIATKGVVQLFNAVKQQQGEINKRLSEAGSLERKREQVLKNIDKTAFLDVLMGRSKSIPVDNDVKDESQENKKRNDKDKETWSVLRDDFVMGTKLKDWDRKDQDEEDSSAPENMDSDD